MVHLPAFLEIPGFPFIRCWFQSHHLFPKLFFWVVGSWWDMSFFVPCVYEHAFLSCLNPSWFFPAFLEDPFPSSGSSKVSWSSLFLDSLGASLTKGRAKLPLLFLPSLRPRACPFMGLRLELPFTHFKWVLAHGLGLSYLWGPICFGF